MQSTEENREEKNKKSMNEIVEDILSSDYVEVRKKPKKGKECLLSVNILTGKPVYEYPVKKRRK
ncbi:MAG: hypothetical protein RE472_00575 [Thermoplasmatales archaeon]|jgi:hypothetical protein|nr:MAG: hypothetical protein RE472_00575 [Thermoplasmatales archaeon]